MAFNGINSACISGNLARDSEIRVTQGGMSVLNFTVAVNRRQKKGDEWEDNASFIDCVMFGKRAEALHPALHRGARVFVQGHLHQNRWENKDGEKRSKLEIAVDEIVTQDRADVEKPSATNSTQPQAYSDDEIPF